MEKRHVNRTTVGRSTREPTSSSSRTDTVHRRQRDGGRSAGRSGGGGRYVDWSRRAHRRGGVRVVRADPGGTAGVDGRPGRGCGVSRVPRDHLVACCPQGYRPGAAAHPTVAAQGVRDGDAHEPGEPEDRVVLSSVPAAVPQHRDWLLARLGATACPWCPLHRGRVSS